MIVYLCDQPSVISCSAVSQLYCLPSLGHCTNHAHCLIISLPHCLIDCFYCQLQVRPPTLSFALSPSPSPTSTLRTTASACLSPSHPLESTKMCPRRSTASWRTRSLTWSRLLRRGSTRQPRKGCPCASLSLADEVTLHYQ